MKEPAGGGFFAAVAAGYGFFVLQVFIPSSG